MRVWKEDEERNKMRKKYIAFLIIFTIATVAVVMFNGCISDNSYIKYGNKICECKNDATLVLSVDGGHYCDCEE